MRTTSVVVALILIACPVAIDAGNPQTTAIMKISGMPGQIVIQVDKTDWSQIQGLPDPTAPRTTGSTNPLGARGGGSLASRGGTLGGRSGVGQIQECTVVKEMDQASVNLAQFAVSGEPLSSATLEFVRVGGNDQEYLRVTLENVVIESVNPQGSGDGDRLEELTFSFGKASWEYRPIEPAQRTTPPFTRSTPTWP